jgi:hypothetical protein
MEYLSNAIKNLKPTAEFSYQENDYSTINWIVLEGDAPTKKEVDDEIKRIKATEVTDAQAKETTRQALLTRLGLTEEEARILLGGN